jgi:hypothetical protein
MQALCHLITNPLALSGYRARLCAAAAGGQQAHDWQRPPLDVEHRPVSLLATYSSSHAPVGFTFA